MSEKQPTAINLLAKRIGGIVTPTPEQKMTAVFESELLLTGCVYFRITNDGGVEHIPSERIFIKAEDEGNDDAEG